jgi:hypothetical protein
VGAVRNTTAEGSVVAAAVTRSDDGLSQVVTEADAAQGCIGGV